MTLSSFFLEIPPQTSSITWWKVVLISNSIRPLYFIFPESAHTLVPLALSFPIDAYQSDPFFKIAETVAQVSALLSKVGLPHNPFSAEWGGCAFGKGRLPSTEAISAVDSPPIKASIPSWTYISKLKSVPLIFLPNRPRSRACSSAIFKRLTAIE